MEIQMRMSCHLTPARMANTEKKRAVSSGEDVKKGEFSHISGKVNAGTQCGKSRKFSQHARNGNAI